MTVKIFPPAVIVALRPAPPLFELAEKLIVWLPEPEAPPVTVSHDALLVAVDVHPAGACIAKLPEPPAAATLADAGEIAKLHGAAACVTVKTLPAAVMVALRLVPAVLAATL